MDRSLITTGIYIKQIHFSTHVFKCVLVKSKVKVHANLFNSRHKNNVQTHVIKSFIINHILYRNLNFIILYSTDRAQRTTSNMIRYK